MRVGTASRIDLEAGIGAEQAVVRLAAQQAGCVSRHQAVVAGMGDSMIRNRVRRGSWTRRYQGVYVIGGSPASWHQDLWAAYLAAGERAVVSHETALVLHGLPSDIVRQYPLELIIPGCAHRRIAGVVAHQLDDLRPGHVIEIGGMRATTPARTVVDLGARMKAPRLGALLEQLVVERKTSLLAVSKCLAHIARPGKPGVRRLAAVLEARGDGYVPPASQLEALLTAVLVHGGLPEPERQMSLPGREDVVGLVDAAYRDVRLILEADGRRWHARTTDMRRDRQRDAEAARAGWLTLRFLYEQIVYEPDEVVATVTDVYRARRAQLGS